VDLCPYFHLIFGYIFKIMIIDALQNTFFKMIVLHFRRTVWPCLFLPLMLLYPAKGQSALAPGNREMVYVHLDRQVYVTGEAINYKVYAVDASNPSMRPCSKILYFTLTGTDDKIVANWRINLSDKPVFGSFMLPQDIKSGMYMLHAYTNFMRNGPADSFYAQTLLIMNLAETTPATLRVFSRDEGTAAHSDAAISQKDILKVKVLKPSYSVNEKVQVELDLDTETAQPVIADVSLSVNADGPFEDLLQQHDILSALSLNGRMAAASNIAMTSCLYRMEDKGFMLTGTAKRRNDSAPLAGADVLLSVIDTIAPRILYARTDSLGKFLFFLGRNYDNKDLILQPGTHQKNQEFYIELDKKAIITGHPDVVPYELQADKTTYLSTVKNLRLINAIYSVKPVSNDLASEEAGINYFSPPDVIIYPEDYASMVNFKDMADNIMPVVKFSKRNGVFNLQLLNNGTGLWEESTMILLNGVPFTDMAYISTLGTKDIKRIEIITAYFLLGNLSFSGLMSIYTWDHKIPETYLRNNAVGYQNTVITAGVSGETAIESGIADAGEHYPDFRNTLCWKPDLALNGRQPLMVTFPASKLTGVYTIRVQGLTAAGQPVSAKTTFEVKE
jgi:hypothetical protein